MRLDEKVLIVEVLHLFKNYTLSLHQHNFLFLWESIFCAVTLVQYLMITWMKINLVTLANSPIFPPLLRHNWNMFCRWRKETFWLLKKQVKCLGLVESSVRSTSSTLAEMWYVPYWFLHNNNLKVLQRLKKFCEYFAFNVASCAIQLSSPLDVFA